MTDIRSGALDSGCVPSIVMARVVSSLHLYCSGPSDAGLVKQPVRHHGVRIAWCWFLCFQDLSRDTVHLITVQCIQKGCQQRYTLCWIRVDFTPTDETPPTSLLQVTPLPDIVTCLQ